MQKREQINKRSEKHLFFLLTFSCFCFRCASNPDPFSSIGEAACEAGGWAQCIMTDITSLSPARDCPSGPHMAMTTLFSNHLMQGSPGSSNWLKYLAGTDGSHPLGSSWNWPRQVVPAHCRTASCPKPHLCLLKDTSGTTCSGEQGPALQWKVSLLESHSQCLSLLAQDKRQQPLHFWEPVAVPDVWLD